MWSAIMIFFAMISLFMCLWILDGSTDSTFLGSTIVRSLITTAFGLLTLLFLWAAIDVQLSARVDDDEGDGKDFLSQKFRRTGKVIQRNVKKVSPPRRTILRKKRQ